MNVPIYNGVCQSDLDFAGFYALNLANDFTSGPPAPTGISGTTPLVSGQNYIEVVFDAAQDNTDWVLTGCVVVNTVDATPLNLEPGILTVKSTTGFTLQLSGAPDSVNYSLQWAVGMTSGGVSSGGGGGGSTVVSVAYSATINVNAAAAPSGGTLIVEVGTLTGNVTLANPSSPTNRQRLEYVLKQDATGNRSLSLGTSFRLPTSSSLVFPANSSNNPDYAAAGKKTRVMAEYDGTDSKWDVIAFVPGY